MDLTAFFKMSYGLYVVSAEADGRRAGCVVNTAVQVTAEPPRVSVAVNKENVTAGVIAAAGAFTVTVIDKTADMPYIGNFGFRSSDTYDKFEKYGCETSTVGSPYSPEHVCALLACRLIDTVDVGTHYLFIGEVADAQVLSDEEPLTYGYYHAVLKGKTPPKASSYQAS
ncbi:flavin reductase family protein [Enorma burkinafasonensis]|uniref:flavin reductase family protein n=1 Tax=Enorma burkinafasonensis TaxID=2590867 RepID=UPI00119F4AD7|nr:flavin reductase family protein [Enorma burkinafasonensis]